MYKSKFREIKVILFPHSYYFHTLGHIITLKIKIFIMDNLINLRNASIIHCELKQCIIVLESVIYSRKYKVFGINDLFYLVIFMLYTCV